MLRYYLEGMGDSHALTWGKSYFIACQIISAKTICLSLLPNMKHEVVHLLT